MSKYTFLRVEVDSAVVERVLGLTPGVEVVETLDDGREDAPVSSPADEDDEGLVGTATPDDELVAEGSPLREYGLLGVGVSFVMLGIATVGIWWYRRRAGAGSDDAETPPPATEFETPDEPATPAPSTTGPSVDEPSEQEPERPDSLSLDLDGDDEAEDERENEDGDDVADSTATEPAGRREETDERGERDERGDVEWEPKWSDSPPEPSIDADADADADEDGTDEEPDEPRPGESVDAAPLLGIAFIAVTGAIVRWAQGGTDTDET
jgi:hypothetical protein